MPADHGRRVGLQAVDVVAVYRRSQRLFPPSPNPHLISGIGLPVVCLQNLEQDVSLDGSS